VHPSYGFESDSSPLLVAPERLRRLLLGSQESADWIRPVLANGLRSAPEAAAARYEESSITTSTIDIATPRRVNSWRATVPGALDRTTLVGAYDTHRDAAYKLAYRILGDESAAEDAVQDAFLKLWTGGAQFDPSRGSMRGLLLTIARHTSIDAIRRRVRRERTENTYCTGATWTSDGPERETERDEAARAVRSALVKLPNEQRSVVEMAYFSGLTRHQIAVEITVPIGTVKSRMRLGMRKLALALGDGADAVRVQ